MTARGRASLSVALVSPCFGLGGRFQRDALTLKPGSLYQTPRERTLTADG